MSREADFQRCLGLCSAACSRWNAFTQNVQDYLGARNRRFSCFGFGSVWEATEMALMAAEMVETTRLYARGVAAIEPEVGRAAGEHLIEHNYSAPALAGACRTGRCR